MKIFIAAGETTLGPYTVDEVRESLRDGEIQPDGLGCIEGGSEWQPLSAILKAIAARPMPGVVEKPSHPIPQKPPTSQKPNIPPKRTIPQQFTSEIEHLAAIRKTTCYPALRFVVNIAFVLSLGICVLSIYIIASTNPISVHGSGTSFRLEQLMMMVWPLFGMLVCIASRQAALLVIDIADTLIFDSSHKKRE